MKKESRLFVFKRSGQFTKYPRFRNVIPNGVESGKQQINILIYYIFRMNVNNNKTHKCLNND